jgi:hypothetical protein|tara:strand:+ start:498 stop:956 length:459 start_codon:yes stop_codon:yes gene_type:complete
MLTSINQIAGHYASRSRVSTLYDLTVGVHKGSVSKKTGTRAQVLTFRLSAALMKMAGFLSGDRVEVLFNETDGTATNGIITRNGDGYSLSPTGSNYQGSRTAPAKSPVASNVGFTLRKGMPFVSQTAGATEIQVDPGKVKFTFPEGTTIYNG